MEKKYAAMEFGEIRELRQLRDENRRLKHAVANLSLDVHVIEED